jgi:hypothetical protein
LATGQIFIAIDTTARLELWRSLVGFPADAAVANLAAAVVARAESRVDEAPVSLEASRN